MGTTTLQPVVLRDAGGAQDGSAFRALGQGPTPSAVPPGPYFIIAALCFATAMDISMGFGNFTV